LLVSALRQAEQVFLTPNYDTVVVLMPNFFVNPPQSFTFDRSDFPKWDANQVEQFLKENNIDYQTVLASFPDEAVSPDGRFMARGDGIYLVETNQKIVEGYFSRVRGWTYNGRGVIYSSSGPCLIETNFFLMDDSVCFFEVPQPVIKLKVPDVYLLGAP